MRHILDEVNLTNRLRWYNIGLDGASPNPVSDHALPPRRTNRVHMKRADAVRRHVCAGMAGQPFMGRRRLVGRR